MAIIYPTAPKTGREVVSRTVGEIFTSQAPGSAGLMRSSRLEELSVADPHQSYFVPLTALTEGKLLKSATAAAWRYLVVQGANAVADVELGLTKTLTARPQFLALNEGPFAQGTVAALHVAEKLPQTQQRDYELRFLTVPAVYLAALWLHSASDDVLIPLAPAPDGLEADRPYSEAQVLEALRPSAAQAVKSNEAFESYQAEALTSLAADTPVNAKAKNAGSAPKRARKTLSLEEAVVQAVSVTPLSKEEIFAEVKKLGYRFPSGKSINFLNTVLYGKKSKFKIANGKFSLA
jgi:hypothetical protein